MCCAEKNYITGDFYNIVEKASHSALQQVPAPDAEDFETALKCFGHCGSECQVECSLKSCCIQAQAIAAAAIKQERERICEAVAELNEGDQFHLPIGRILAIIDNGGK